jgi:hypothetical protein
MRLDFAQVLALKHAKTRQAIGFAPAPKLFEARQFLRLRRHNYFSGNPVRDPMFLAKPDHGARS